MPTSVLITLRQRQDEMQVEGKKTKSTELQRLQRTPPSTEGLWRGQRRQGKEIPGEQELPRVNQIQYPPPKLNHKAQVTVARI